MDPDDVAEVIRVARELALKAMNKNFKPKPEKRWKDLDGIEWTQRCLDADWNKDKPKMGWWKEI